MACDICGKPVTYLETLKDEYQTDTIKAVCSPCLSVLNKKQGEIFRVTHKIGRTWLRRFMEQLSGKDAKEVEGGK